MKTTLKELHDQMLTLDNTFAANTIKRHMTGLFYELTGNLDWDLSDELDVDDDLHNEISTEEPQVSIDYDLVIVPDNEMDVCVRVKFNVDATVQAECDDGMYHVFPENISYDVISIVFDYCGDEWDMSKDKVAKKFVNKVLDTWI